MDDAMIVKALRECGDTDSNCRRCPACNDNWDCDAMKIDAADRIEALKAEVAELRRALQGAMALGGAAKKDLRIANKCITCAYNTGREGKDFCNSPDNGIRFVNRKEDRYIRVECIGWDWRGPCAENGGAK